MNERDTEDAAPPPFVGNEAEPTRSTREEIEKIRAEFQHRLLTASLRTEAVRAGMIDLDGLKLLDVSSLHLDENDALLNGRELMQSLRQRKPWLFRTGSSSSASATPSTRPVRQKSAMEMTDEEYRTARNALIKH